ncbi:heavy metal translocating P-type ATPase [Pseudogracilibacillus sp. SO30301A]|uniref:heavy metal translocating P-type ATPase n=1 Tax=Pseudogracilibacillus sp. SO30301A TaxID=3098291 RepID=UPI00300E1480
MNIEKTKLEVKGMYCAACVARIEKVVSRIEGVEEITVNLATETGSITFDKNKTSLRDIISKINNLGFEARKSARIEGDKNQEIKKLKWNFIFSAMLTFPLAWAMLAHFKWTKFMYIPPILTNPFFQFTITIPIQFIIGYQFYDRAWKAIKNGSTNMDVLVVLSTSAAFFYSHYVTFTTPNFLYATESAMLFYETSAFIITFILLGRFLEAKTKVRTAEALKKLYEVQTKQANLYIEGKEKLVNIKELVPDDMVIIKPGEKVPIDGQVTEGHSMIDESLLTGESIPIEKNTGAAVYAGTINQNGLLKVKVTKKESETVLSTIISIVEEAQNSKAPIQHIADKITEVFVPIVIMIAAVTFVAWYFIFQPGHFNGALGKVIAVLIIACPCALGLATPTSIMVGSGRAAQYGILFKEGRFLELLGKNDYIVLDKTGTITKGVPQVTDIFIEKMESRKFMQYIGAVEHTLDHPVARAIVNKASSHVDIFQEAEHVKNIPGYGIKAVVHGHEVVIASSAYFEQNGFSLPKRALKQEELLKNAGKTVMVVYVDGSFAGMIGVFDEIKSSSIQAVKRLKQLGYPIILLTGDHKRAGLAVARKVGIKKVYTGCTPNDKAKIVEKLKENGHHVVMVGDGINDAPALAVSHVGVALGTGSDVAIESGDVTIIQGDLHRLVDAIQISKKTMINIKQNFVWAFLYNVTMIPFAMFGILVPWLAGAAMAFSSISVVLNSLRLKRVKI